MSGTLVCLIVLGRVLYLVNVRRGSSACIPPVHMSVVVSVVLCVRVCVLEPLVVDLSVLTGPWYP